MWALGKGKFKYIRYHAFLGHQTRSDNCRSVRCVGGELGEDEVIKVVHHGDVGVEGDRDL